MRDGAERPRRPRALPRVPGWARLGLVVGMVGLSGVGGTWAHWTDAAPVTGGTFTSGTIDLRLNGSDSLVSALLPMATMVPGISSAQVVSVDNSGTVPLRFTLTGGLAGTDAAAYATATALRVSVARGATRSVSGSSATCSGGTSLLAPTALTGTTTTTLLGAQGPLAAGASDSLCVQVTLDPTAPSTLQGKTATLQLSVTATSDLG